MGQVRHDYGLPGRRLNRPAGALVEEAIATQGFDDRGPAVGAVGYIHTPRAGLKTYRPPVRPWRCWWP